MWSARAEIFRYALLEGLADDGGCVVVLSANGAGVARVPRDLFFIAPCKAAKPFVGKRKMFR